MCGKEKKSPFAVKGFPSLTFSKPLLERAPRAVRQVRCVDSAQQCQNSRDQNREQQHSTTTAMMMPMMRLAVAASAFWLVRLAMGAGEAALMLRWKLEW